MIGNSRVFTSLIALLAHGITPSAQSAEYLDPHPPGDVPRLFAPQVLQPYGEYLQAIDVSSDLTKYYLQVTDARWAKGQIIELTVGDDRSVSVRELVGFPDTPHSKGSGEPAIDDDRDRLYFWSRGDVWSMDRNASGWDDPVKLGPAVNRPGWREGCPTVSDRGTLYFHSHEDTPYNNAVFCSRLVAGSLAPRERIDVLSQEGDAGDPGIAPDDSFIVFASSRPGGRGNTDLYVSFHDDGHWSTPQHLGDAINTADWELGPKVSPDGQYLFFYRRDQFSSAAYSRIYWVSTAGIKKLAQREK